MHFFLGAFRVKKTIKNGFQDRLSLNADQKYCKMLQREHSAILQSFIIAPDKAAYCVFTQFPGSENAIKFISVRTKTQ